MRHLDGFPYGETLRNASVSEFILTETAYAPSLRLPRHSHEQAYFCFVLGGGFTEAYGNRSRTCHRSYLILHPAGETHSDQFHTSTRCFNIQMNACWLERVGQNSSITKITSDFHNGRLAHLAAELYREFLDLDEFSSLAVEGLTLEIMAEASRRHSRLMGRKPPQWLDASREIIITRFAESLSLSGIAALVGVHPVHLARTFRRYYGCTAGEYLRQTRIEFARRELTFSDATLSEIAGAAGFSDQSQFSKTFRRHTGRTPAEFRKISRMR